LRNQFALFVFYRTGKGFFIMARKDIHQKIQEDIENFVVEAAPQV